MIPLGNAYLWEIANEFAIAQKRQWAGEMSMEALDAWQSKNLQRTIKYCQDKSPLHQVSPLSAPPPGWSRSRAPGPSRGVPVNSRAEPQPVAPAGGSKS